MKTAHMVTVLASLCMTGFTSAAWLRLPTPESPQVNLANKNVLGTAITATGGLANAEVLISDDPSASAALSAGKSEAVLALPEQLLIDSVSFVNDGAAGKVVVSGSADQKEWIGLAQATFTDSDRHVPIKFAGAQVKYVRLAFEVGKSAAIRSLHVGGANKLSDYKAYATPEGGKAVEVDATTLARSSRPIYMFPTPTNVGEADGPRSSFKFPKSKERYRTVVYDLGAVRTIKKFSAAYSRVPTRLQVFAFEQLPEKKDWRGKMTLEPEVFDTTKPVVSGEDARGDGNIQIAPDQPVKAQYVALRFEPNYHKRAVTGLDPDWSAMAFAAAVPFVGLAEEFGIVESGIFAQAEAAADDDDFVVYDAATGGTVPLVLISRSSIKLVMQQQLGREPTPAELADPALVTASVNTILTAAGYSPISNSGGSGNPESTVADPSNATGNTGALNALGLSYRSGTSGGGTGGSPFIEPTTTTGTTTTDGGTGSIPPTSL